jgi:sulfite oxidase
MTEVAVFSGITNMEMAGRPKLKPGKTIMVKTNDWKWSGGGRDIFRVDITGDGGESSHGKQQRSKRAENQKFGRAWAWVFWECEVPAIVKKDGTVDLASKAVDLAFNSQPESVSSGWNVRGLGNSSWHRASTRG